MYCLRLFIVVLQETTLFTTMCYYCVCSLKSMCMPSFGCSVSQLHGHLYPYIIMYGLRLFIVVLQELHCIQNCLHVCMIRVRCCYHFIKFHCYTLSGF